MIIATVTKVVNACLTMNADQPENILASIERLLQDICLRDLSKEGSTFQIHPHRARGLERVSVTSVTDTPNTPSESKGLRTRASHDILRMLLEEEKS